MRKRNLYIGNYLLPTITTALIVMMASSGDTVAIINVCMFLLGIYITCFFIEINLIKVRNR